MRVFVFVLLSAGCPAARSPFLFSHLGKDRLTGGGTTGAGAEVANTERQKERERTRKGLESMREEDTTAAILRWIHTTNEGGNRFHTEQRATERGSQIPKGRWKHWDGEKRADDP